jgi:hypothetical protein
MRKIELWLPDKIHDLGLIQARQHGTDASALYAGLLTESLLADTGAGGMADASPEPSSDDGPNPEEFQPRRLSGFVDGNDNLILTLQEIKPDLFAVVGQGGSGPLTDEEWEELFGGFDVSRTFVGFPKRSIEYAQRVVDEALQLPRVIAQRFKNGISFKPNFLLIEALLQRKSGIRVSLYGERGDFAEPPESLGPGRGSYSRIVVTNDQELDRLLPLVRQAYEHRFASQGESDAINSI